MENEETTVVVREHTDALAGVLSQDDREALRQTLIAAHPDAVPELIAGSTVAEIVCSVGAAKAAYKRAADAVKAATPVSAGGGIRTPSAADVAKLSPIAKIALGLKEQ